MIRSDSKFEIGDENLPCESSSPLPLPTPTHHPVIDSVHTRHLHFYLPCILTISSISSLSVCSVGNPFKKSFQIVRYNIHRLCCYITFKNQKYRMLIVNLRSFECLVWVLCRIWKWQHIRKREIAFCTIIEFFNIQPFDPLHPFPILSHPLMHWIRTYLRDDLYISFIVKFSCAHHGSKS